jgi:hypothetical protein
MQVSFNSFTYKWRFLRAKVRLPMIGIDILSTSKLLVDTASMQLIYKQPPAAPFLAALKPQPPAAKQQLVAQTDHGNAHFLGAPSNEAKPTAVEQLSGPACVTLRPG